MNNSVKMMIGIFVAMLVIVVAVMFTAGGNNGQNQLVTDTPPVSDTPTTAPTQGFNPTDAPTQAPTMAPTQSTTPTDAPTVAPTQAITPTEAPTQAPAQQDTPTEAPTQAPAAQTDADILKEMSDALNKLKATPNFKGHKLSTVAISLTDCSIPGATAIINPIIKGLAGTDEFDYNFVNGTAENPDGGGQITPNSAIPPSDKNFDLVADGMVSISKTPAGDGFKYAVKLKPESVTYETMRPTYHSQAMDYLDLASVDLGAVQITQADLNYAGADIEITTDSQGRLLTYHAKMPIQGVGGGKAGFLSANATIDGYLDETWTITY